MAERVVLVASDLPFEGPRRARLAGIVAPDRMVEADPGDGAAFARALEAAEVAILAGDLDDRVLAAPRLRWVHCDHAGLTRSARPEVFARGLVVTGSAGRSGPALAEHAMMFALLLCSRFVDFYEAQRRHEWRRDPGMADLRALHGRTMGILGLGHTGTELARRAKAFGLTVLAWRRRDLPAPEGVDRVFSADRGEGIETILDQADLLVLALGLSDATHRLIGARELARMKRSAVLINMARGGLVDHDALAEALAAGRLAGAGLDVTEPEPLPPGHRLWDVPNLLITPHFTAALPDRADRSLDIIAENFRRYRAGEPLRNRLGEEDVWTRDGAG